MARVSELRELWPSALLRSRAAMFSSSACASAYLRLLESIISTNIQEKPEPGRGDSIADSGFPVRSV
jgi:hypothetical protein